VTLAKAKENLDTKNTLPHGWNWVLLEDLFDVKQGAAMSPVRRQGIAPRPFLRTLNVLWGSVDLSNLDKMDFSENEVASLNLRSGDLLVCEGGDVGRTAIWKGELDSCLYQNHIHRLRRRHNNVAPEFYAYWMQAAFKVFQSYKGKEITTTIPNLSGGKLKSFMVPLPPTLAEQERIAHILNEQMTAVEKARAAAEAKLEAAKALQTAYLRAVFESEEAKGWQRVRLEQVCQDSLEVRNPSQAPEQTFIYVDISSVDAKSKQIVGAKQLLGKDAPSRARKVINAKDVIVATTRPNLNAVAIVPESLHNQICSTGFCVLRADVELNPTYLFFFVQTSEFVENLSNLVKGALYPAVTDNQVNAQPIPLPPTLAEQERIAAMLNERMGAVGEVAQTIQQELEAINALPAAFLRRAFAGGL